MSRIARALAALLLLTGLAVIASAQPASAGTDVCVGSGSADIAAPGLVYPAVDVNARNLGYSFSLNVTGGCFGTSGVGTALSASGTLSGFCGHSTSLDGTANGHHNFVFVSAGSLLIIAPGVLEGPSFAAGVANAIPIPTQLDPSAGSCLGGLVGSTGAVKFLVTGAVVLAP